MNYLRQSSLAKTFITDSYDNVFIVLDMNLLEMHIMKYAFIKNPSLTFCWLEDGGYPYFQNTATAGGFDKNKITRMIRKITFKYLLGCGRFYDFEGRFMGANKWLTKAFLTFPSQARDIYNNKEKVEISEKEFNHGLGRLYNEVTQDFESNSIFILMDKLDVYADLSVVEGQVSKLIAIADLYKVPVYYKYHPRENESLSCLDGAKEVAKEMAVEAYYRNLVGKQTKIVGIKSTSLQTAKKLDLKVFSLAKIVDDYNADLISFYNSLGVILIKRDEELEKIFTY